jgi:hypothetical protein
MSSDRPGALDAGNELFHEAYSARRDDVRLDAPILVVMPTELVLRDERGRKTFSYCRPSFAAAKSAAHMAVALFTLSEASSHDVRSRARISNLTDHLRGSLDHLRQCERTPLNDEIRALFEHCSRFAALAHEQAPSPAPQAEFARDAGPRILRITELATSDQIAGLHEAVDIALGMLSADEQRELQVVVVGDHQARVRSLGMQYFQYRFREQPGADERVTYGENIGSEEMALVGTRRLDRLIARAFFGDEKRLQRDVLGDAAKRCLDAMRFPR